MENIKVSITPLTVSYTTTKPISILIKLKRILISTNYELQKFQCKKQFALKSNIADLTAFSNLTSFIFKLSKQFEISNTKVDLILFGIMPKGVNMLGVSTIDLGQFQQLKFIGKDSISKEFRLKLQKSQDPNAYVLVSVAFQRIQRELGTQNNRTLSKQGKTLKTQSYLKQQLIEGRRKQADLPSAYQISKRNYKQIQVSRQDDDRNRSKSTKNDSGNYKKRFEYQNKYKSIALKEDDDCQQPKKAPSLRAQQRDEKRESPTPRLKTPEPILYNSKLDKEKRGENKNNDKYSLQISVDLYKENQGKERTKIQAEKISNNTSIENSPSRIKHQLNQTRAVGSIIGNNSQIGKISQQFMNSNQLVESRFDSRVSNQGKLNESFISEKGKQDDRKRKHTPKYNEYRQKQAIQEMSTITENRRQKQVDLPKQLPKAIQLQTLIQREKTIEGNKKKEGQRKQSEIEKINSRDSFSSENKFKMITDKLQQVYSKIKQCQKGGSPVSNEFEKQSNIKKETNDFQNFDQQEEQHPRKPFSPYGDKQSRPNGSNKNKNASKDNNSVKTFGQYQFRSQTEESPKINTFIKSFDHLSQSQSQKNDYGDSAGLGSITQQINQSIYSQSNLKINANMLQMKHWRKKELEEKETKRKQENGESQKLKPLAIQKVEKRRAEKKELEESSVANFSITGEENAKQETERKNREKKQIEKQNLDLIIKNQKQEIKKKNKVCSNWEIKISTNQKSRVNNLHKGCEEKILALQNFIDQQQETHRKKLLERELEVKNICKEEEAKRHKHIQQQISRLREQNNELRRQKNGTQRQGSPTQPNGKQEGIFSIELSKLKDQNSKLRGLVDKLNLELEQSDEKHFQALTAGEKKDLEYKRKLDELLKTNQDILQKLRKKEQQLRDQVDINLKLSGSPNREKDKGQGEKRESKKEDGKSYKEQYLAEKKRCVNLQAQVRQKSNEIRFMKIKIDNLTQQKRDLENEIDSIAANNKLELARQGNISRSNLEAASVVKSVKNQNEVFKTEINILRKQVHELNEIMNNIILEGAVNDSRISQNKEAFDKESTEQLEKKYEALEKKAEAYQEQIKEKQMKFAQIVNLIFSYNNPKLMDEITRLLDSSQQR